ncbi:MAG: hypothetical protein ABI467_22135 [Kofleriaceae bacterium]
MSVKTWLCALLIAGCNLSTSDTTDDRPETFGFITEAILKPSCATAECHSAMKAQSTDVFDSVAAARASIHANQLVFTCEQLMPAETFPCGDDALNVSYLYQVIDDKDAEGDRMPRDQALSNKDIVLIREWIRDGADGLN